MGKNTRSTIVSKGISCEESTNSYRGLVRIAAGAENARNYSQCDSMLVGDKSFANTFPYIEVNNDSSTVEHEATTSRISADQLFYLQSRGLDMEAAVSLLVNGFCQDVFRTLPLEFAVEAVRLLEMKLEDSVG
jgi:Fe-S cluster assembly protein SufB